MSHFAEAKDTYVGMAADCLARAKDAGDRGTKVRHLFSAVANIEDVIDAEVRAWRDEGATWQQIGETLAITRQAAQQRYGR